MTFLRYLRQRLWLLALLALCAVVFAVVLSLYRLETEAVGYASALCGVLLLIWGTVDFLRWRAKLRALEGLLGRASLALDELPTGGGPLEEAYQELLREMGEDRRAAVSNYDTRRRETMDYFTMWVHQIKTPIAAMRLALDDGPHDRELAGELFRIERYVELALSYLRMDGASGDYVIREYPLMPVLRQAARKYAPMFIRGKVALELRGTDMRVLTDEKWLQLVVEQLLSNAVKYAPGGHVSVYAENGSLYVRDDGVGIAPEDLPRVFEWSYTGCNGRMDKRATGIGLYLCREICTRLGHSISIASEPGKGTVVSLGLARPPLEVE